MQLVKFTNSMLKLTDLNRCTATTSNRNFWAWLNIIFNQIDTDRLKQLGPDRACAEWLLRNGAAVKWTKTKDMLHDYNQLPSEGVTMHIQEVDASGSSINHLGFRFLQQCEQCEKIILHDCPYILDKALQVVAQCTPPKLRALQVSKCLNITDSGLLHLQTMKNLQSLVMFDLPYVKDKAHVLKVLKGSMPSCAIIYKGADESAGNK